MLNLEADERYAVQVLPFRQLLIRMLHSQKARALSRISLNNPSQRNLVRMLETFQLQGRLLVAMEALDYDLQNFMVLRYPEPPRVGEIETILRQLFGLLRTLEGMLT